MDNPNAKDIGRFRPYPKYKDSGVEWLDEFPIHWQGMPLKRWVAIKITDGPHETPEFLPNGVPFVSAEAMQNGRINFEAMRGFISEAVHQQYCRKCHPRRDDLFLCKSGATTGKVVIIETDDEFSVWSPLAQIRANRHIMLPRFLFHALQAQYVQEQVRRCWSAGTQPNIAMGIIEGLFVVAPPLEEQNKCVDLIDRETAEIDELVAKKERLIELLQEKRTALITRAVTKGLDPNVPMKNSGVEWLGKIPTHWEVIPFKRLFNLIYRYPTYFGIEYVTHGVREVRGEALRPDGLIVELSDQRFISPETNAQYWKTILGEGDLVMSVRGTMGKIGLVNSQWKGANITANLIRLSPNKSMAYSRFLVTLIVSNYFQQMLDRQAPQTTIKTITVPQLAVIPIPLPPPPEQRQIVEFLYRETAEIESLIAKIREGIEKLKEYRIALISAAVTGKIDVREEGA